MERIIKKKGSLASKYVKILLALFTFSFLIFSAVLFIPRNYHVAPIAEESKIQYWSFQDEERIAYVTINAQGKADQAPIIYLHGGPGGQINGKAIEVLQPLTERGHDLYFYDQIGSGHSTRLDDIGEYSVERHTEDLRQITEEIGAPKVILLGHSWGACLAVHFLQEYPEKIDRLILSGAGPILPINTALRSVPLPDSLIQPPFSNEEANEKMSTWRSMAIQKCARLFQFKLASDREADHYFAHLNRELSKSTHCQLAEEAEVRGGLGYYSHLMTVESFDRVVDRRDRLGELDTPILLLRGQCDNQKWGYTQEYLSVFKNSRLQIIQGVGHDILAGDRDEYFVLIRTFLEEAH